MNRPSLRKSLAIAVAAAALASSCVSREPVREAALADESAGECTKTQGYWKNHEQAWPVESLTIGSATYTQAELLELFRTPVKGDASILLAHQLIAALLNVAAGASPTSATQTALDDANAWMVANADADGRLPYQTAPGSDAATLVSQLADTLDTFNQEGPCGEPPPGTGGGGGSGGFILPSGSNGVGGAGGFILPTGTGP